MNEYIVTYQINNEQKTAFTKADDVNEAIALTIKMVTLFKPVEEDDITIISVEKDEPKAIAL